MKIQIENNIYFILAFILVGLLFSKCSNNVSEPNFIDKDIPNGMVYIPSGKFLMGGKSDQADQDEFPRHNVEVNAFFMDKTEVSNADFMLFVKETAYITVAERDIDWDQMKQQLPPDTPKPPDSILQAGSLVFKMTSHPVSLYDESQWWEWTIGANWQKPEGPGSDIHDKLDHPVVHIAYEDAVAYADWSGKRLPTEAEWEWAAMGGLSDVKYPWGNDSPSKAIDKANFWQGIFPYQNDEKDGYVGSSPIKTYPANGYGLYDMSGNVWEWCSDQYDANSYKKDHQKGLVNNPKGSESFFDPMEPFTDKYVMRGGSFLCSDDYCSGYRVSRRMKSSPDSGFNHTGFRCVKDIDN